MSLANSVVESFGGYENAKAVLDNPNASLLHNVEGIKQRLLEYRHQHNIFEVNDQVVLINKPGSSSSLHRVLAVNAPTTIHVCPINQVSGSDLVVLGFMASPYYLRHATDAEFAANRRLETNTIDSFIEDGGFDKAFVDVFGLPESVKQSLKEIS